MNRFDTKLFVFTSKAADLVCLNILWFFTSLPIFTAGAAICALYDSAMKVLNDECTSVFKTYFVSFGRNFKKATAAWLILLGLTLVILLDIWILRGRFAGTAVSLLWIPLALVLFLVAAAAIYVFPLIARYENSVKAHLINSLVLAVSRPLYTFPLLVITVGVVFISLLWFPKSLFFWIVCVGSVIVFINLFALRRLFTELEGKKEEPKPENRKRHK